MKKRFLAALMTCMLSTLVVSGCGEGDLTKYPNGKLYVYNWGEYIDEDVISEFEDEYGIDVIYDMFETNEIMFAKLAQDNSAYDVVCPSNYMIQKLIETGIRVKLDDRNEKVGYKIREWSVQKVPYIVVVGDNEADLKTITVRKRGGEQETFATEDFLAKLNSENFNGVYY